MFKSIAFQSNKSGTSEGFKFSRFPHLPLIPLKSFVFQYINILRNFEGSKLLPLKSSRFRHNQMSDRRIPTLHRRIPTLHRRIPTLHRHVPTFPRRIPTLHLHVPTFPSDDPTLQSHIPILHNGNPTFEWSYKILTCGSIGMERRNAIWKVWEAILKHHITTFLFLLL